MCRRNRLTSDQWSLYHVFRFQLRLAPHHTNQGGPVCVDQWGTAAWSIAGPPDGAVGHAYACQCNRRNGAVVIGVRLVRRTKALSSLGVVLRGLPCLGRSLACLVSACFLTSLLMTMWLISKLTPIFPQDISAPCIAIIYNRTFSGIPRLSIPKCQPSPTLYRLTKARSLHLSYCVFFFFFLFFFSSFSAPRTI